MADNVEFKIILSDDSAPGRPAGTSERVPRGDIALADAARARAAKAEEKYIADLKAAGSDIRRSIGDATRDATSPRRTRVPQPPSDGDEAPAKPTPKAKSEEAVSKTKSAVAEMVASRAGLGGLQSALAAAGPIGVAVIAAEKAINDAVESINRNTELLRRAGDAAARVAGNDNFGGLMSAADGVAESFGRIPVVGGLLEAQFKQVTEILKQGNAIGETLVRRGEELARYSPELAYTSAINQVRRLHADVREAERMGPAMASLMDSRGRLEIAFREAMMPLREQITFMQIGMTERLNAALEAAREAGGGLRGILEGLRVVSQGNFDQVRELVRRARARDEERRVADADRRLQEVQEKLDQQLIPEFNQPDLANIQPPDLRLNIPIFNNP